MTGDKDFIYDEDESVKFIQNYLPQELKGKFSNDDINNSAMTTLIISLI